MPAPADTLASAALVWDGAQLPTCDRSGALRQSVGVYLGRDPFANDAPLTIRVGVRRATEPAGVIADVSEVDEQGHVLGVRSVRAASCETLDEPLTLVVALMLDETPLTPERQPELAPSPPQPKPPSASEADDSSDSGPISTVPEPAAEPPQPAHAFVSAGIGTSFGKVPFFSYGPQLQVVFKPKGFWGLELSAGALGGSGVELPGSGTIDFLLLELGGALCPLESLHEGLLLRGCGGFTVGWLRAESHDLEPNRRRTEVVFSPDLHVQVAQSIGKGFFVGGGLAAAFPIRPNQYAYRDADGVGRVAFQMSVPSLNLNLFLARVFP